MLTIRTYRDSRHLGWPAVARHAGHRGLCGPPRSLCSLSMPLRPLLAFRPNVSRFPVFQCFDHAYIGTLIEEGLLGDYIVQTRIQIQCRFVPLSDMQSDFRIVVLACLPLRGL